MNRATARATAIRTVYAPRVSDRSSIVITPQMQRALREFAARMTEVRLARQMAAELHHLNHYWDQLTEADFAGTRAILAQLPKGDL